MNTFNPLMPVVIVVAVLGSFAFWAAFFRIVDHLRRPKDEAAPEAPKKPRRRGAYVEHVESTGDVSVITTSDGTTLRSDGGGRVIGSFNGRKVDVVLKPGETLHFGVDDDE